MMKVLRREEELSETLLGGVGGYVSVYIREERLFLWSVGMG